MNTQEDFNPGWNPSLTLSVIPQKEILLPSSYLDVLYKGHDLLHELLKELVGFELGKNLLILWKAAGVTLKVDTQQVFKWLIMTSVYNRLASDYHAERNSYM